MRTEDVPIDSITIPKDRRKINHERVKGIAASIKRVGLLHAIGLTNAYELCYGGHRLEAAKLIGWKTIPCCFVDDDTAAELAEIDENLERQNFDALEFSQAVAKRKRLWERINPERVQHVAGGKAKAEKSASDKMSLAETPHFSEETAELANVSRKTVERAVAIGEKLTDKAAEILADTKAADNKTVLAQVAALPPAKQPAAARRAAAGKSIKKPKPEGTVVDSLKGVVDKSLESVFTFAAEWSKLKSALSTAKGLLTKIIESDTAGWLDGQECERHIAQARALLSFAMPFTECCKCRRKPTKECSHCKGKGWLTKANFTACASDADKAWLDKRAKA